MDVALFVNVLSEQNEPLWNLHTRQTNFCSTAECCDLNHCASVKSNLVMKYPEPRASFGFVMFLKHFVVRILPPVHFPSDQGSKGELFNFNRCWDFRIAGHINISNLPFRKANS